MSWTKLLSPILFSLIINFVNCNTVVQTENGLIRGKSVESGKVEAFLGIPYAEPPTGPLRFAKPVPKTSWNGVYNVTQLPPPCVQVNFENVFFVPDVTNMDEDCLYLNLWKPHSKSEDGLKAVMFFIHGGGLVHGSSSLELYDGAKLAEYGDVVVVTINYRVGILGFFAGFTEDAPGSQGLYDQVMALQWINDNVKHFHGDPDNIVIFGESAGARSVSMHQISPLSKHLFKRAILQSGSSISLLYDDKNEIISATSQLYANQLDCVSVDGMLDKHPKDILDCLRNTPVQKIAAAEMEVFQKRALVLSPWIGNDFLPDNTIDMFRKGHFKDSDVLMGITRDEGPLLITVHHQELFGIFGEKDVTHLFNETIAYEAIRAMMGNSDTAEDRKFVQSYLDDVNEETGYTYLKAIAQAVGDKKIICGNIFQAEYHSMRDNSVYFYMFDHRTSSTPYADWFGVPHFDEVQYVFGNPMYKHFTEQEKELSRDIMDMWVAFAKTGNPTIPSGITWQRYTYEDPKYYVIGKHDRMDTRPDHHRCERWRKRFRCEIDDTVIQALKKH